MRRVELVSKIRAKNSKKNPDFFKWNRELQEVVSKLVRLEREAPPAADDSDFDQLVKEVML